MLKKTVAKKMSQSDKNWADLQSRYDALKKPSKSADRRAEFLHKQGANVMGGVHGAVESKSPFRLHHKR